jgi:hypothetical protein
MNNWKTEGFSWLRNLNLKSPFSWDVRPGSQAYHLLLARFLVGLLFDPEDGGITLFSDFGGLVHNYSALYLQMAVLFIVTALRNSNPIKIKFLRHFRLCKRKGQTTSRDSFSEL